jgi:hypothetical protein
MISLTPGAVERILLRPKIQLQTNLIRVTTHCRKARFFPLSSSSMPEKPLNRTVLLLALLLPFWAPGRAAPVSNDHLLVIDRSSTPVAGGKATLSIGPLRRVADTYTGDYQMKVSPYFFKSEKGKLAINVPSQALASVTTGIATEITGTATSNGQEGQARRIDATATPSDHNHGSLKLWFLAGDRKMVFSTSYHFEVAAVNP